MSDGGQEMLNPDETQPPFEETIDLIAESLQPTTALPISEAAALAATRTPEADDGAVASTEPVTPVVEQPTEPPPAWLPRFRRGGR